MVNFDRLYDPEKEMKITRDELRLFDPVVWNAQGSGKRIYENSVASAVEKLWSERTQPPTIAYAEELTEDSLVEAAKLVEGAAKQFVVNGFERNPAAREQCMRKWGLNCNVCNFNFELFYGQIGKNYIHVHHLKLLSEIREEYEIDSEVDLRPVCPNCHAMLHQKKPALSIEELEEMIQAVKACRLSDTA